MTDKSLLKVTQSDNPYEISAPWQSNEVVEISLSHDRLVEYLSFLKKTDEIIHNNIQIIKEKLLVIDQNCEEIESIKHRLKKHDLDFEEVQKITSEHIKRIEYLESRLRGIDNELIQIRDEKHTHYKKMNTLEHESDLLVKRFKESNDRLRNFEFQYQVTHDKMHVLLDKVSEEMSSEIKPKLDDYGRNMQLINEDHEKITGLINQLTESEGKYKEFEQNTVKELKELIDEVKLSF